MLVVDFGCMMFHYYLYGCELTCQRDCRPLEDIQLKHVTNTPPRLQKLLMKI